MSSNPFKDFNQNPMFDEKVFSVIKNDVTADDKLAIQAISDVINYLLLIFTMMDESAVQAVIKEFSQHIDKLIQLGNKDNLIGSYDKIIRLMEGLLNYTNNHGTDNANKSNKINVDDISFENLEDTLSKIMEGK